MRKRPSSFCRRFASVAWLALALLTAAPAAEAPGDTIYGALILATNAEHPAEAPPQIREQVENLHDVFGYNQFRLLGDGRKASPAAREDWQVSSRRFSLHVNIRSPIPGGYSLGLQLDNEKRMLVAADVKLSRASPLFIRGPMVGQGQLVIVLVLM